MRAAATPSTTLGRPTAHSAAWIALVEPRISPPNGSSVPPPIPTCPRWYLTTTLLAVRELLLTTGNQIVPRCSDQFGLVINAADSSPQARTESSPRLRGPDDVHEPKCCAPIPATAWTQRGRGGRPLDDRNGRSDEPDRLTLARQRGDGCRGRLRPCRPIRRFRKVDASRLSESSSSSVARHQSPFRRACSQRVRARAFNATIRDWPGAAGTHRRGARLRSHAADREADRRRGSGLRAGPRSS
jgi:hypothetical protein